MYENTLLKIAMAACSLLVWGPSMNPLLKYGSCDVHAETVSVGYFWPNRNYRSRAAPGLTRMHAICGYILITPKRPFLTIFIMNRNVSLAKINILIASATAISLSRTLSLTNS